MKTTKSIVEFLLQTNKLTRDSDKELLLAYWEYNGLTLTWEQRRQFMAIDIPDTVRRTRQKFQENGMYLPSEAVAKVRSRKAQEIEQRIPTTKPEKVEALIAQKPFWEFK